MANAITKKGPDGVEQEIVLQIEVDNLTIGDLETLESPGTATKFIDTLQKAVIGTDVRTLPMKALRTLATMIMAEMKGLGEEKN